MDKKAFLLGFFSIGSQVLLLRELVADFGGDELFIGTALFGWMMAVAFGAYLGGKKSIGFSTGLIFILAAIFLPVSIAAIRLSPNLLNFSTGEIVPFSLAAIISILLTFPTGFLSGLLFSSICRKGHRPSASINKVYLFEGFGAFIGGIATTALVGPVFSNLSMAFGLGVIIILFNFTSLKNRSIYLVALIALLILIAIKYSVPKLDLNLNEIRYSPYKIENSFETFYGSETIISRDSTIVLITDNKIEATYPDLEAVENILIPPLLYKPDSKNILIIGRAELGVRQLSSLFPDIKVTAIDPRASLGLVLDNIFAEQNNIFRIDDDPISHINNFEIITKYDIIIVLPGEPDNYKAGRYYSEQFLLKSKRILKPDGILYIPTKYDTDRFISEQKKDVLSAIYSTAKYSFDNVMLWPGTSTLFFMSNEPIFDISYKTLIGRIDSLDFEPQFISDNYLKERLDDFKQSGLVNALDSTTGINSLENPGLIYKQILLNSKQYKSDSNVTLFIFNSIYPVLSILLVIVLLFVFSIIGTKKRNRRKTFGLFLYFAAGLTTLTAEQIVFYVHQSTAGSLFSQIGLMIGTFMLGLTLGTFIAVKSEAERMEYPSLLLLLTSMLLYLFTYAQIPNVVLLYYHLLFLFTVALAGGGLFVAATYRYYFGRAGANRGTGYAFEIVGSAFGALFALIILLPLIGLFWLINSVIIFLSICLIGAYITE